MTLDGAGGTATAQFPFDNSEVFIDLMDLGTLTFSGDGGSSAQSGAVDDVMPTAGEFGHGFGNNC